ncbi:MAG TPA: hypothetical protein PKC20_14580, partial [Burkholderiaceae bacterium]|nr:hypothetical protein [Burkholderiaceae bacterium]
MTARLLALLVAAALGLPLVPAALAAPSVTPYNRYTLQGSTKLGSAKVAYRSYLLLPKKLNGRTANGGPVLRFGRTGSCRLNLPIGAAASPRDVPESAATHAARLQPATTPD